MCNLREGFVNLREGFVETPWRLRSLLEETLREGFAEPS